MRNVIYTKRFRKDCGKIRRLPLARTIEKFLCLVKENPFQNPPPYEKLKGCENTYSRRINEQHRLVYSVGDGYILFRSYFGHYED